MNILIISQCSAKKNYFLPVNYRCLSEEDFFNEDTLKTRINSLYPYRKKAIELYDGAMQKLLYPGIEGLRRSTKDNFSFNIDHYIISAGFGLVNEYDELVPYNKTFQGKSDKFIKEESIRLGIPDKIKELIPNYDYIFFLVGEDYLSGIEDLITSWNNDPIQANKIILFTAKRTENNKNFHLVFAGVDEAKKYSYGIIGLKGYLFKAISDYLITNYPNTIEEELSNIIKENKFLEVLSNYIYDSMNLFNLSNINRIRDNKTIIEKPQRKSLW